MPNELRYSRGAIALHWLIAAAILFEIGLGWRMDLPRSSQSFPVYQLHKSVGITILLLTVMRIGWRLTHRPPAFPDHLKPWERGLAHMTHLGLYALMLGLPLTGWLMVSTSKLAVPTVLYGLVPWPHLPGTGSVSAALRESLNQAGNTGHHLFILSIYLLFALHIAGALKHHLWDRGDDLARMLPARRSTLSVLLALVGLSAVGAVMAGNTVTLGGHATAPEITSAPAMSTSPTVAALASPAGQNATTMASPLEEASAAASAAASEAASGPVKWVVQKGSSSLGFHTSWSGSPVTGRFQHWDATILFDPEGLAGSKVDVTVDMTSAATGVPDTESALPEADWFAAATHPTAKFTAQNFRKLGGNRYEARGSLTMRGITRPVTLPFTLDVKDQSAHMTGSVTLDRTVFGIGQGQWASTDEVAGNVVVSVRIVAARR